MSDVSDNPAEQVQESNMPDESTLITGYTMNEAVAFWERIFASYPTMDDVVQLMVQAVIEANKLAEE